MAGGALRISFDEGMTLLYAIACAFLLLVLALPLPFKQTIRKYMKNGILYLTYAAILPIWLFLYAFYRIKGLINMPMAEFSSKKGAARFKSSLLRSERNIVVAAAALLLYVLLFRFYQMLDPDRKSSGNAQSGVSVASPAPLVSQKGDKKQD